MVKFIYEKRNSGLLGKKYVVAMYVEEGDVLTPEEAAVIILNDIDDKLAQIRKNTD